MLCVKFSIRVAAIAAVTAIPLAFVPSAAVAQSPALKRGEYKGAARAMVEAAYPADGPGAAVIVARNGRVIYSDVQGLADVDARRPIRPETQFRLGSITKQFTAATILQLVAERKVSLDDPISRFFPDWPKPGASATVRQLLNHTSGIQDHSKIPGWINQNRLKPFTTAQLLAVLRDLPARAQPGHAWEYNNGGYVVLGAIIESVTEKAWHEAMAERITRPLGLRTIRYGALDSATGSGVRGYTSVDGRPQIVQPSHMSVAHAAGGLVGSVNDLARWAHALHRGRVISPALYQEMTRPARLADGSSRPYGFGVRLQQFRGRPVIVHGGAGGGLDTDSVYVPSENLFVAVFANSDQPTTDPSVLTRRLTALSVGEPIPTFTRADVDLRTLEPLFGVYSGERGPPLQFSTRDGKLLVTEGQRQTEAFPAGEDRFFFSRNELTWFRFVRQPSGAHVIEVHLPDEAQPQRAVRTGAVQPPFAVAPAVLKSYVGAYQTETLAVTITLDGEGRLIMAPEGQGPLPMRPVSLTEFRIDGTPMRVVFHPENGQVSRFTMYRGARELHGRRVGR